MLNEKDLLPFLAILTPALSEASSDRDKYKQWWHDECRKTDELNATIKTQHAEIVRLNEELQAARENTTCIDGLKAAETEAANEES